MQVPSSCSPGAAASHMAAGDGFENGSARQSVLRLRLRPGHCVHLLVALPSGWGADHSLELACRFRLRESIRRPQRTSPSQARAVGADEYARTLMKVS